MRGGVAKDYISQAPLQLVWRCDYSQISEVLLQVMCNSGVTFLIPKASPLP